MRALRKSPVVAAVPLIQGRGRHVGQQLGPTLLFLTAASGQADNQRFAPLAQVLQLAFDIGYAFELAHALGPRAQFATRLRPAQQQNADQAKLPVRELEALAEQLLVTGHAPAVRRVDEAHQPRGLERGQGVVDGALVVLHHGITVGGLVTGKHERVHRQWVLLRRRQLLFDKAPDNPRFFLAKPHLPSLLGRAYMADPAGAAYGAGLNAGAQRRFGLRLRPSLGAPYFWPTATFPFRLPGMLQLRAGLDDVVLDVVPLDVVTHAGPVRDGYITFAIDHVAV